MVKLALFTAAALFLVHFGYSMRANEDAAAQVKLLVKDANRYGQLQKQLISMRNDYEARLQSVTVNEDACAKQRMPQPIIDELRKSTTPSP